MADAGVASRRDCEAMIEQGLVEVNGRIVNRLPVFVNPGSDRIVVDGQLLKLRRTDPAGPRRPINASSDRVYVMLHKPDRVLCTTSDESAESASRGGARTTVTDLVQHRSGARIYPVGRLDYHSTGLVLMTNDGELADRLTHARYGVTRTYRVTIKGAIREDILDDLRRRIGKSASEPTTAGAKPTAARTRAASAGDPPAEPCGVRIARAPGSESPNTVLEVTLREGRNQHLSAILEQMGCLVRKLTLVGIGTVRLRGVAVGEWRNLTREEVDDLRAAGGLIAPRAKPRAAPQGRSPSSETRGRRPPAFVDSPRSSRAGSRSRASSSRPGGKADDRRNARSRRPGR
jgi:23S rRNA pseudouridine2605 synthase